MADTTSRKWWLGLVYVVAVLNALGFVLGLFREFDVLATVVFLLGAVLAVSGLNVRRNNQVLGNWMIVLACIPPILPFWIVVPALISILTVVTGIMTGELKLAGRASGQDTTA